MSVHSNYWNRTEIHRSATCSSSEPLSKYIETGDVVNTKIRKFFFLLQDKHIERDLRVTISITGEQNVVVELTNDVNPVFLFILSITKHDFDNLRSEQGLNVEFKEFPQALVDLLDQCKSGVPENEGRFKLMLNDYCGTVSGGCVMDISKVQIKIIEECAFKNICHLTLDIMRGTELQIRQKLEAEVYKTKQTLLKHSKMYDESMMKIAELDEHVTEQNEVIQKLNNVIEDLKFEKEEACNKERSQAETQEQQLRDEFDKMISQQHEQFQVKCDHMQTKLASLEQELKLVNDNKLEMQTLLHEKEREKELIEMELMSKKQEVNQLRGQNEKLDFDYHDKDKTVNILRTRLAVTEQELKDNNVLLLNHQNKVDEMVQEKINYQTEFEVYKSKLDKKETALKNLTDEILKANEIISKQQLKISMLSSKVNECDLNCLKLEQAFKVKEDQVLRQNDMLKRLKEELTTALKSSEDQIEKIAHLEGNVLKLNKELKNKSEAITEIKENFKRNLMDFKPISSQKSLLSYRAYLSLPTLLPSDSHRYTDDLWEFLLQDNGGLPDEKAFEESLIKSNRFSKVIKPYIFRYLKRFSSVPLSIFKSRHCTPLSVLFMPEGSQSLHRKNKARTQSQENISNTTEYAVFNNGVDNYLPRVQSNLSLDDITVQVDTNVACKFSGSNESGNSKVNKSGKENTSFPDYAPVGAFKLKPAERYQRVFSSSGCSTDNKCQPGLLMSNPRKTPAVSAPPLTREQRNAMDFGFKTKYQHRMRGLKTVEQVVHGTNSVQSSTDVKATNALKSSTRNEIVSRMGTIKKFSSATVSSNCLPSPDNRVNTKSYKTLSKEQKPSVYHKNKYSTNNASEVALNVPEPSAYFVT